MAKRAASTKKKTVKKPVRKSKNKTSILIKYDVGFPNALFIRGQGAGLSWTKGEALKNVSSDEWLWETDQRFEDCEFKVLVNDECYEAGENHHVIFGQQYCYTPNFS